MDAPIMSTAFTVTTTITSRPGATPTGGWQILQEYSDRYVKRVDVVRVLERSRLPGSEVLATAVARSLFKLMSKDEYEGRVCTRAGIFARNCRRNLRVTLPSTTISRGR